MTTAALALDLGTTRIKAGVLARSGELAVEALAAAEPTGPGDVRESDAGAYLDAAEALLATAGARATRGTPLGIATQRSSFLLWRARDGAPVTPLISWQDRSAAAWCLARASDEERVRALTGLPLSPHYAGPKLAVRLAREPELRRGLERGELLFGTLECALAWRLSAGRVHGMDAGMAARTLLLDIARGAWSSELLELFGVPEQALPAVLDTWGRRDELENGLVLAATVADQPAGLLAALGADEDAALVNAGTGAFVLRPTGPRRVVVPGYLAGPVLARGGETSFALEGTVNGGGATAERLSRGPTELPEEDPSPEAFCLPDENGVGAPWWRPRQPFAWSEAARTLAPQEQRRVVLEGLAFRIAGILEGVARAGPLRRVVLSGGLARDPFLARALAALLDVELSLLDQPEGTLLGAARLAAGIPELRGEPGTPALPAGGRWLREKQARWRSWVDALLARAD